MKTIFHFLIHLICLATLMSAVGCRTTSPPQGTPGYSYTTQKGDTLASIAGEYLKLGMEVTTDQIMSANPGLNVSTNLETGVQILKPETGARLFIPDKKRAYLDDLETKAAHGDPEAQYAIATIYENGEGLPKDYTQAAMWYGKAADQGQGKAQFWLARLYDNGLGLKTNQAKAVAWLTKSANHGYALAQLYLGKRYQDGDGVPKDGTKAVKWYQAAANQGVPWAQFNLGRMYYNGDGVAQNRSESFYWVQLAAVKGLAEAQALLGALYATGDGVESDDAEAFKWMNKASIQGMVDAQYALGRMYADGKGVNKDEVQAYKWMAVAVNNGAETAKTNLVEIEGKLSAKKLKEAKRLASEFRPFMTNEASCSWSGDQTYSLYPEMGSATGFFVTEDGYLVSNHHVVKDAGEIFLVTATATIPAKVVKVDEASDLALLKTTGRFSALPVTGSHTAKLGSTVVTVGFPGAPLMGYSPKFSKGDIAGLSGILDEPVRFQISVPIQPGNSGGALLDSCGNVVGVVSHKINVEKLFESIGALPENVN
ncbi:MAG: trypsin-like peptidase domain-containing protein, partial [Pseudomonadota bacterium]